MVGLFKQEPEPGSHVALGHCISHLFLKQVCTALLTAKAGGRNQGSCPGHSQCVPGQAPGKTLHSLGRGGPCRLRPGEVQGHFWPRMVSSLKSGTPETLPSLGSRCGLQKGPGKRAQNKNKGFETLGAVPGLAAREGHTVPLGRNFENEVQ